jgi:hypothetical protein
MTEASVSSAALDFLKSFSDAATADVLPVSTARAAAKRREEEEAYKNLFPGKKMPDGNIFLCQWEPVDRHRGESIGEIFNVFAAPHDLKTEDGRETFTLEEAVQAVSELKDWCGHDGSYCKDDSALDAILKYGVYKGGWIVPPLDLLFSINERGSKTQPDSLYIHRSNRAFNGTFNTEPGGRPSWYLSCTEPLNDTQATFIVRFWDRNLSENEKNEDGIKTRVRPVRLEPVKKDGP